jgi:hypothetical protein
MDEQVRLSDADRERAAALLGEHYVAGRLSTEEHAERVDRVWAARTRGDLGDLFADLPVEAEAPVRRTAPRGPAYRGRSFGIPRGWVPLAVVALVVLIAATPVPPPVAVLVVVLFLVGRRRRCAARHQWVGPRA